MTIKSKFQSKPVKVEYTNCRHSPCIALEICPRTPPEILSGNPPGMFLGITSGVPQESSQKTFIRQDTTLAVHTVLSKDSTWN